MDRVEITEYRGRRRSWPPSFLSPAPNDRLRLNAPDCDSHKKEEAFRSPQRRRHQLTGSIRKGKQRVRALFLSFNIPEPPGIDTWGKAAVASISRIAFPDCSNETKNSLLNELHYLKSAQQEVDAQLRLHAGEQDEARRIAAMRSVPGVGEVVATAFAAGIYRPERFTHSQEVTTYLGLDPVVRQSVDGKEK